MSYLSRATEKVEAKTAEAEEEGRGKKRGGG
jgi:hypothetical protein